MQVAMSFRPGFWASVVGCILLASRAALAQYVAPPPPPVVVNQPPQPVVVNPPPYPMVGEVVPPPPPTAIATIEPVYYEGRATYWYAGRWVWHDENAWRTYTNEPPALRDRREHAPPARVHYDDDRRGGRRDERRDEHRR